MAYWIIVSLAEILPGSARQNDKWWGWEIPMALERSECALRVEWQMGECFWMRLPSSSLPVCHPERSEGSRLVFNESLVMVRDSHGTRTQLRVFDLRSQNDSWGVFRLCLLTVQHDHKVSKFMRRKCVQQTLNGAWNSFQYLVQCNK